VNNRSKIGSTLINPFNESSLFLCSNACHNGLGEMATFLSVFSKKVTACPIPLGGTGYALYDCFSLIFVRLTLPMPIFSKTVLVLAVQITIIVSLGTKKSLPSHVFRSILMPV